MKKLRKHGVNAKLEEYQEALQCLNEFEHPGIGQRSVTAVIQEHFQLPVTLLGAEWAEFSKIESMLIARDFDHCHVNLLYFKRQLLRETGQNENT